MTDEDREMRAAEVNLAGIPKVEMHLHLEGAMRPETYVELRRRDEPAYRLEQSPWHDEGYRFDGLSHFLDTASPCRQVGGGLRAHGTDARMVGVRGQQR